MIIGKFNSRHRLLMRQYADYWYSTLRKSSRTCGAWSNSIGITTYTPNLQPCSKGLRNPRGQKVAGRISKHANTYVQHLKQWEEALNVEAKGACKQLREMLETIVVETTRLESKRRLAGWNHKYFFRRLHKRDFAHFSLYYFIINV